jgi:hypothetical protein
MAIAAGLAGCGQVGGPASWWAAKLAEWQAGGVWLVN